MRISKNAIVSVLAAGVAFGVGSAPAAAQSPAVGNWELATIDGAALPARVEVEEECVEEVTAARLTLEADGEWELEVTERETCGAEVEEETEDEDGRYSTEASTIRFQTDSGEDADAADDPQEIEVDEPLTGTVAEDGTLRVRIRGNDAILVFRRI